MQAPAIGLESSTQRLYLAPELGGAITAWDWKSPEGWTPIFRPWDGKSEDRYTMACFPLVPWSNRITQGGFEQHGVFHPVAPNRAGEPYPIHGDGWLQAWSVTEQGMNRIRLALESHRHGGNPYDYMASQSVTLLPNGIAIELMAMHLGDEALPYGLGLHPYFVRNEETLLLAKTGGVWLAGADPIPIRHTTDFPPTWDYNRPAPLSGPPIDNCFTGWDGHATITYPDRRFAVTMTMSDCKGYSLMYRPPGEPYFCYEPITQPIDAFHMPGRPGLVELTRGSSTVLRVKFEFETLDGAAQSGLPAR
ncbi:MAG TPA: aldose 1-epimerase [Paucimonas sp.]|nr:aldose 1-epimerase [Paucimonas sp.]